MSTTFNPNKYSTFVLRKDYQDGNFPAKMETYDNIIYGGQAFSGDTYIPLDPAIEIMKPDNSIYEKYRFVFGDTKKMIAAFDAMMRAEHIRLSLDGKHIWEDYEKAFSLDTTTRTLFFHDYDIDSIDGARAEIKRLLTKIDKSPATGFVAMKYPVKISTYDDLLYWSGFKNSGSFYNLEFYGPLADEELFDFIKNSTFKASLAKIDYIVTANFKDEDDFLIRGLSQIYNQVLFLRRNKVRFLLKYEDGFFKDKRWEKLIDFFNCYMKVTVGLNRDHFNRVIDFDTLYSFSRSLNDTYRSKDYKFNKQDARELFMLVQETNYEVFKSFYEGHTVELIGGRFENDSTGY